MIINPPLFSHYVRFFAYFARFSRIFDTLSTVCAPLLPIADSLRIYISAAYDAFCRKRTPCASAATVSKKRLRKGIAFILYSSKPSQSASFARFVHTTVIIAISALEKSRAARKSNRLESRRKRIVVVKNRISCHIRTSASRLMRKL